jgi:hypothetical protein
MWLGFPVHLYFSVGKPLTQSTLDYRERVVRRMTTNMVREE